MNDIELDKTVTTRVDSRAWRALHGYAETYNVTIGDALSILVLNWHRGGDGVDEAFVERERELKSSSRAVKSVLKRVDELSEMEREVLRKALDTNIPS